MSDQLDEELRFLRDQAVRLEAQRSQQEEPWMEGWEALLRQAMNIVRQEA